VGKFWSLLGLTVLLFLPFILIGVVAVIVLATSSVAIFAPMMGGNQMPQNNVIAGGLFIGGLALVALCAAIVLGIVALGLQTLGERAIVLDNLPVIDAVRKAWKVFKAQLGNIILLALIIFLIDVAVSVVVGFVLAALFIPTAVTMMGSQTLQTTTLVLGALGFVVAVLVSALIGSLFAAFNSTVWTLAYEQFTHTLTATSNTTSTPLPSPA
jgi:hypothetical protein